MKKVPGFLSYIILNNDGIVIRWDQQQQSGTSNNNGASSVQGAKMTYEKAVQYSHLVLDLCGKCKSHVKELFEVWCSASQIITSIKDLYIVCHRYCALTINTFL